MATRNTLKLDTSGFEGLIQRLDELGGNVVKAVDKGLAKASAKVAADTKAAIAPEYLPAKGVYSKGDTEKSIVTNPQPEWDGLVASVPVGFDFSEPGAGGYLITGTPKMAPDKQLHKIYKGKKYMQEIQKIIGAEITDAIIEAKK